MTHCPKCDEDISDTYQPAEFDVGIMSGGYYCDACDLAVEEGEYEGHETDVAIGPTREPCEPIGTPISQLAGTPGNTTEQRAAYDRFVALAKRCGYD